MDYGSVAVGDAVEFGEYEMTETEIVEFAEQYDPQPFHVDRSAAEASPFGGLVASGWHTCTATMRLLVRDFGEDATLGSPGVEELRWRAPVRPGDVLRARVEITEKRPLEDDPNRGRLGVAVETVDQDDEVVMTWRATVVVRRDGADRSSR